MALRRIFISLLLLWSCLGVADERLDAARQALLNQVEVIRLAYASREFDNYHQQLKAEQQLPTERLYAIAEATADFWRRQGIATGGSPLTLNDPYMAVIASEPRASDYLMLSNHVRYLLWLARHESWLPLEPLGWLKPGDSHKAISEIRGRLQALGDYPQGATSGSYYDERLKEAVLRFQVRHGLKSDAIIGPATLAWLNRSPRERAQLLVVNFIQRAEYLAEIGERYLLINIPAYEMWLVDDDRVALRSKVIVGKPYRQTPIISGEIKNLVLNPSWRVPRRLLTRDLLPKVREDGSYISSRNFEVFDYHGERVIKSDDEWRDVARGKFPYRLVQKPGAGNTLGRYKFFFPNEYSIYLHDTSDKALFERSDRALSSGCIRVEKVEQLANWMASHLVRDKQTWVNMQRERDKTQWFAFDASLPIHLVYWTSWLDDDNVAQFREDIYKKNQKFSLNLQATN
ncbi:L,D-transpeptidase family protein [Shewanella insulae]|uniref:L,D-transpeptidase family protein n=1 Tax=Shewanella insulae TaxID=2681496 RepID=UPI001EFCDDDC|nr:L,D-transpeptidase family protein [Shewanella insulae]MCG9756657.1 L,D-transpeptidase family protein [Shewanella insulae]